MLCICFYLAGPFIFCVIPAEIIRVLIYPCFSLHGFIWFYHHIFKLIHNPNHLNLCSLGRVSKALMNDMSISYSPVSWEYLGKKWAKLRIKLKLDTNHKLCILIWYYYVFSIVPYYIFRASHHCIYPLELFTLTAAT